MKELSAVVCRAWIVITLVAMQWPQVFAASPDVGATYRQEVQQREVEEAMQRAQQHLLSYQEADGSWNGRSLFHTDRDPDLVGSTALYVLFLSHVGIDHHGRQRAIDYLIASQRPDGSWGSSGADYYAALALERAGLSPLSPALQRVYEHLKREGASLQEEPFFTQFHYALAGRYPWIEIDFPLLGDSGRFSASEKPNAYRRDVALAFFVLKTLYVEGGPSRDQRQALRRTESLLLQRQLADGSWFNFEQGTIFVLTALYELGYDTNDEPFVRGLRFLESLQFEDGSMAIFRLPIFDTTIALHALEASGYDMDSEQMQQAVEWLVNSRNLAGGWGWTPEAGPTSDVDDTAFSASILAEHAPAVGDQAISFILSRQNQDGGWSTFEPDFTTERDVQWIPMDSHINDFGDPSIPDGTAHVLLALGKAGYSIKDETVQRAVNYLQRVQFENGMWFAWWAIPYVYGTGAVLAGLEAVGADMNAPYVQRAVQWLQACQNPDGGWGEGLIAREGPEYACQGESTASQTAWAILGLLAAQVPPTSEVVERGVAYLLASQRDDGSWKPEHTMLATPPFPYSMEHAETSWPLWALAAYRGPAEGKEERGIVVDPGDIAFVGMVVVAVGGLGLYGTVRRNHRERQNKNRK